MNELERIKELLLEKIQLVGNKEPKEIMGELFLIEGESLSKYSKELVESAVNLIEYMMNYTGTLTKSELLEGILSLYDKEILKIKDSSNKEEIDWEKFLSDSDYSIVDVAYRIGIYLKDNENKRIQALKYLEDRYKINNEGKVTTDELYENL